MSNHSGGSMLNSALYFLEKEGYLENKRPMEIANLFAEFCNIGAGYDCNDSEILDKIAAKYNICWNCQLPVTNMVESEDEDTTICEYCYAEFNGEKYTKLDDIEVKDEDVEIEEIESSGYYRSSDYRATHKPTGYVTRVNYKKTNCIEEIKRYLAGEIIK